MLTAVSSALSSLLEMIGEIIESIVTVGSGSTAGGALSALLPLFAIGIAISLVMLTVKIIRRIAWGA